MKLVIKTKAAAEILESLREGGADSMEARLLKALGTGKSTDGAVPRNTRSVSGNLYSMDTVKACVETGRTGMNKSILVFKRRRTA